MNFDCSPLESYDALLFQDGQLTANFGRGQRRHLPQNFLRNVDFDMVVNPPSKLLQKMNQTIRKARRRRFRGYFPKAARQFR